MNTSPATSRTDPRLAMLTKEKLVVIARAPADSSLGRLTVESALFSVTMRLPATLSSDDNPARLVSASLCQINN